MSQADRLPLNPDLHAPSFVIHAFIFVQQKAFKICIAEDIKRISIGNHIPSMLSQGTDVSFLMVLLLQLSDVLLRC